jgi:tetratricopeptide (TPR) repeat protein
MELREPVSTSQPTPSATRRFKDALVIMDETTWLGDLVSQSLQSIAIDFTQVSSNILMRQSWSRFHDSPFMIIHWENELRSGGAIIEEILEIDRRYDAADKIIIITTNPIHEDVVFFSELGIRRVIRARSRAQEIQISSEELKKHVQEILNPSKATIDGLWRKILVAIDMLPAVPPIALLTKIEESIEKLRDPSKPLTARHIEAVASIKNKRGEVAEAIMMLQHAIDVNPNYFRSWNTLIDIKTKCGDHKDAYSIMQKMQLQNRNSVKRLVAMGEAQLALNDLDKAETYFKSALDKDAWSGRALNGLGEVKFWQNELGESRLHLSKSAIAYQFAAKLNLKGIELVATGGYQAALEHYCKAQYILPQQEKGPQVLYNIALCYAKWGRLNMAVEFLVLAIIKEPNYKKASRLLDQIRARTQSLIEATSKGAA